MSASQDRPYYTVAEAARRLQVSPSTVWRWIDDDRLPAYRVGRRAIRIRKEDLETIIQPTTTARPVTGERVQGPRQPGAPEHDIWAGYDPRRVQDALARSAGALSAATARSILDDLPDSRGQDSPGRPA